MLLQSDRKAIREEQGLYDDMTEFEVPAAIPTIAESIAKSLEGAPSDPLERQKAKEKIDFEAQRLRRRQ